MFATFKKSRVLSVLAATVLVAPTATQSFLHLPASFAPQQIELSSFAEIPFLRENARVQMFFGATEVGSASFVATGFDLRYDGPVPMVGAPGPFTIDRVTVRVGTSAVRLPSATFAANTRTPLQTVFDGPVTFWPDQGSQTPAPWGGRKGGLTFPFSAPVAVAIPSGGWLVVDLTIAGNNIRGAAHAILDGEQLSGGPVDGSAFSSGLGCAASPGAATATILTSGVHAPGAAHSIHGDNLGASAPVLAAIGISETQSPLGGLPWTVPGTSCLVHTSWELFLLTVAGKNGSVPPGDPGTTVPVPPLPRMNGAVFYEQLISVVPSANPPWGLVFSDKRTVRLGVINPRAREMYTVANGQSATSPYADWVTEFGYAMRLHTQ